MANLLSWLSIWQKSEDKDLKVQLKNPKASFAPPEDFSGATDVIIDADTGMHGAHGYSSYAEDYGLNIETTRQLINTYRTVAEFHEVDDAIQHIVDEAIVEEDTESSVSLDLEDTNFSEKVREALQNEFDYVLKLLHFRRNGSYLFRKWYVDSRMYLHKVIDPTSKELTELRLIDPLNMQLYRKVIKKEVEGQSIYIGTQEVYRYTPPQASSYGVNQIGNQILELPKDSIIYIPSGIIDGTPNKNVIGYLHRAIKAANQLKMLEDALVIYRLARAPERRVFYVDVGQMPNSKATQYVNDIMNSMKNRIVYDSSTGKVKNQTAAMSMMEDIYLPRRDGSKGTEISTLPGGTNLGDIEDVQYFNKKLYKSLRIPKSRVPDDNNNAQVMFGNNIAEMDRDELNFIKFVRRLRIKFDPIFLDALLHQAIAKKIVTESEWKINRELIRIDYNKDSYIEESKRLQNLQNKLALMRDADEYVGKYYSKEYVYKEVLELDDDQIAHERKQIKAEIAAKDIIVDDEAGFH